MHADPSAATPPVYTNVRPTQNEIPVRPSPQTQRTHTTRTEDSKDIIDFRPHTEACGNWQLLWPCTHDKYPNKQRREGVTLSVVSVCLSLGHQKPGGRRSECRPADYTKCSHMSTSTRSSVSVRVDGPVCLSFCLSVSDFTTLQLNQQRGWRGCDVPDAIHLLTVYLSPLKPTHIHPSIKVKKGSYLSTCLS